MVSTPISWAAMFGMAVCLAMWRKSAMSGSTARHLQRSSGGGCITPKSLPLQEAAANHSNIAAPMHTKVLSLEITRQIRCREEAYRPSSRHPIHDQL